MGVPLDDTWIHFQFADNFAKGHLYQYNIGEPAAGTTSPLYVVLLAAASFVSSNFIFNSIFLSATFHLLSCILIFKLSYNIFSEKEFKEQFGNLAIDALDASLLTGLLTVFAGRFTWSALSGMETTMFAFFTIWSVYNFTVNYNKPTEIYATSILLALSTVSRPEGLLLFVLFTSLRVRNYIKEAKKQNVLTLAQFMICRKMIMR